MKLTQSKLATLAAILPNGTALERVRLAVEIWDAARTENPSFPEYWQSRLNVMENRTPLPLEMFLAEVMPKKSAKDRLKVWGEFITWKMRNARDSDKGYFRDGGGIFLPEDKITAKEAATLAKQAIGEHKEAGVPKPKNAAVEFQEWAQAEKKRKASEKARRASYARHDKTPKDARGQKKTAKTKKVLESPYSIPGSESAKPSSDFTAPSKKFVSRKQRRKAP